MIDQPKKPKPLLYVLADAPADWLGINFTDKTVLQALASHLNSRRNGTEVWPSNDRLAALTGGSTDTIARSKRRLHKAGLVKLRRDRGKSDMVTVDVDEIRRRCHPPQIAEGTAPDTSDPPQNAEGTPRKMRRDPPQIADRTAKEPAKGNSKPDIPSLGCSADLKVGDGDHQRKMQLMGVVAEGARQALADAREQPTEEKDDGAGGLAKGARRVNERPG